MPYHTGPDTYEPASDGCEWSGQNIQKVKFPKQITNKWHTQKVKFKKVKFQKSENQKSEIPKLIPKKWHTRIHKSEIPSENAAGSPLETSGTNLPSENVRWNTIGKYHWVSDNPWGNTAEKRNTGHLRARLRRLPMIVWGIY